MTTRILMMALGYIFIVLGILGLFLPFLQGILFLVVGLLILARYAPWAERLLERLKTSHPTVGGLVVQAEETAERWMHKVTGGLKRLFGRA